MDIKQTLTCCIDALNSMTVTGRHNCTVIAGVCNDIDRVLEVLDHDQNNRQSNVSPEG